ncbi:hypothetical protein MMC28_007067 [Mycoblastus sanguinarius]|nr:hypothetical protein [Mycoblastus sanguinarius]
MDPLSVIGGVSSIVGFALHGSRRLYELIDGTRNAPKDVKELSKEIKAFYNVLGDLQRLLQRRPDDGTVADVLQSNQESLEQCLNILDELMLNIRSHTKPSPDVKTSTWQGFLWSFKVKDVRILMDRLGNRKATLLMALTTVNINQIRDLREDLLRNADGMKLSSLRARRGSEAQETEVGFALRGFLDSTSSADDPHTEVSSAIGYPSDVSNVSAGDEETSNRHDREDYPDTGILSAGENSGSFAGVSVPVEEETLKRCEREDNPTIEASSPVSHAHDVDALFAMFLDESSKRGFRAECSSIDASRPKFWRQNFTNTAVPNEDEVSQHQDREAQSILACPAIISDTSIPDESELPQNQKTEEAPKHIQTRHNFDERALANMKGDKTTHFGGEYTTYSTNSEDGALLDAWVLHLIRVSNDHASGRGADAMFASLRFFQRPEFPSTFRIRLLPLWKDRYMI